MERLIFLGVAIVTLAFLVKFVLAIKADNARRHRMAQYEQWLRDLPDKGPEALKAAHPYIHGVLSNPDHDFHGPWESTKL